MKTYLINVNLNVVRDVLDDNGVRGVEARLIADLGWDDVLEEQFGVDDRDAAECGVGGVLPEIVLNDEELQGVVCNGHFEQGAGLFFLDAVGVLQEGGDGDVDGIRPGVDERDVLGDLRVLVDVRLVVGVDEEGGFVGDKVVAQVGLGLLVLEKRGAGIHEVRRKVFDVL
jgi:hypothetical protein